MKIWLCQVDQQAYNTKYKMRATTLLLILMAANIMSCVLGMRNQTIVVETNKGGASLSSCQLAKTLNYTVQQISEDMLEFGISYGITRQFGLYIINDAAASALITSAVKCFTVDSLKEIGNRLGIIIQQYLNTTQPQKRRKKKTSFNFDGNQNDPTLGGVRRKCCSCASNERIMTKNGQWRKGCWAGPCCPNLCGSLNNLRGGSSVGEDDCCRRSSRPCLHRRV